MRSLGNYSLNDFHIWHTAVSIIFIMLYITFLLLIFLMTRSLYLLTAFIQLPPLHLLPMVTTNLTSFSMSVCLFVWVFECCFYECFCLFLNYNWPTTLRVPVTQHNGLVFLYISKWSSCCLVTVCHCIDTILTVFPLDISYRWLMYLKL